MSSQLATKTLEDLSGEFGHLYQSVSIAKDPLFGWVQIVNDVTILGEELRRARSVEASERAVKVMFRLLEFLGYYSSLRVGDGPVDFATYFAWNLQRPSFANYFAGGTTEGISTWILLKYPRVCSKCGRCPCHCMVWPRVIEDRRENPTPYLKIQGEADQSRATLVAAKPETRKLTTVEFLSMFKEIYGNAYSVQDPWKIGMHLSEEMGEATIELSRLCLAWRGRNFPLPDKLDLTRRVASSKIGRELEGMEKRGATSEVRAARREVLSLGLDDSIQSLQQGGWNAFCGFVTDKFKEEVADVFGWLAAVLIKLAKEPTDDRDRPLVYNAVDVSGPMSVVAREFACFTDNTPAGVAVSGMRCRWCGRSPCSDECLVTHGVSSEIIERISRM